MLFDNINTDGLLLKISIFFLLILTSFIDNTNLIPINWNNHFGLITFAGFFFLVYFKPSILSPWLIFLLFIITDLLTERSLGYGSAISIFFYILICFERKLVFNFGFIGVYILYHLNVLLLIIISQLTLGDFIWFEVLMSLVIASILYMLLWFAFRNVIKNYYKNGNKL